MIFGLQLGATSVALSTSVAAFVNASVLHFLYRKRFSFPKIQWQAIFRILASTASGAMACLAVSFWLGDHSLFAILQGGIPVFEHSLLKQALILGLPGIAFVSAFVVTGYFVRCQETLSFLRVK